ncbi:MAG: hypothetical protein [Caudoviricetes sp.]|nr:MAG: hypothetical protein [Caudoviricetes sp.]
MGIYSSAFLAAFKPKPIITGSEWAEQFRYIPPPAPEAGPWKNTRAPYLMEIMDVLTDRTTRDVTCMMSSQVGKTEILLNAAGYFMHQEPSSIMMVQPTLDNAEAFSKERFDPTIKYTKCLSGLIEEKEENAKKDKRQGSTTMMKYFTGGYAVMVGANSPASLASRPIRVLLMDEIDRYPRSLKKEGDPIKLATQRTTNYHNKKILKISTPTVAGLSRIEDSFELSDKRYFYVPCPHCGEEQTLDWSQVKWLKLDNDLASSKSATLNCKICEKVMRGSGRPDMDWIGQGHWVKTAQSEIAGFYINSLYSAWVSLSDLVKEWLDAVHSRDKDAMQTFWNLKIGLPWVDAEDEIDYEELDKKHKQTYNAELHKDILCLTAGVDVQDAYLVGECVGWSHDHESYGVEYKIFAGDPALKQVWDDLDEWLLRPRYYADGSSINIAVTCIDSGGHHTNDVYKFCKAREHRHVYAIKGSSVADKPFLTQPSKVGEKKDTLLFMVGVNAGKSAIMSALNLSSHGPLYCHFPSEGKGYDLEYFKGLKSEIFKRDYKNGNNSAKWVKIYERNEPLDCRNYAMLAREILKPPYADLQVLRNEGKQGYVIKDKPAVNQTIRRRKLGKGVTM